MKKLILSLTLMLLVVIAAFLYTLHHGKHYDMREAYGTWYGTHEDHQGLSTAYFILSENGTFEAIFAKYKSTCKLIYKSTITGVWGLDQSVLFMITQKQINKGKVEYVDSNKTGYYSAFKVLKLDEMRFVFAREKSWLKIPRFSKYSPFTTFSAKSDLTKYIESNLDPKWSACSSITSLKDLD